MATTLKSSKQRDAILNCIKAHHDHPTAEEIYQDVRTAFPNISLGTIYRNLALLIELKKIKKVCCNDASDHYEAMMKPHSHFICTICGGITDIPLNAETAMQFHDFSNFNGDVTECNITFSGICAECLNKLRSSLRS